MKEVKAILARLRGHFLNGTAWTWQEGGTHYARPLSLPQLVALELAIEGEYLTLPPIVDTSLVCYAGWCLAPWRDGSMWQAWRFTDDVTHFGQDKADLVARIDAARAREGQL
jgi:hypothetical protein